MNFKVATSIGEDKDLYQQVEMQVSDKGRLYRAALHAGQLLEQISACSAIDQEKAVNKLNLRRLQEADISDDAELGVALMCIAVLEAARGASRATATERVWLALDNLSDRYQANW